LRYESTTNFKELFSHKAYGCMENIFSGTSKEESLMELRAVVILISDALVSDNNKKEYSNQIIILYAF